jgi:FkbM family methyltransferase
MIRQAIKRASRTMGFDVLARKNVPELTLLGLGERPIRTILDVGANSGGFAKYITEFFPGADLHCFEPLPGPCAALEAWLATRPGVSRAYRLALGEKDGTAEFTEHEGHSPSSSFLTATSTSKREFASIRASRPKPVTVLIRTLDSWCTEEAVVPNDATLLKLDVQGFELSVLRGATETLRRIGACVTEVNIAPLYQGQSGFAEIVQTMNAAGLCYFGNLSQVHAANGSPLFIDAVFVRA